MTQPTHKICCRCKMVVSKEDFRKNRNRSDGLDATCKHCRREVYHNDSGKEKHREYRRKRATKLPEHHKQIMLNQRLVYKYGLTLKQFDELLEVQDGVCAICGGIEPNGKRLSVDHNHNTGKVRGLLCNRCNIRLNVIEDTNYVRLANLYLKATDGI